MASKLYESTGGSAAELADVLNYPAAGLDIVQAQNVASQLHGRLLVDRQIVDLFAAELYAAVAAGTVPSYLYDRFVGDFGGNAGTFIGD